MKLNKEKLEKLTVDLRHQEPRLASEQLAGFDGAARCLDKCRASLLGKAGDYTFGCPMDQAFFSGSGINKEEFKDFVAGGASDDEVEAWIEEHAHARA